VRLLSPPLHSPFIRAPAPPFVTALSHQQQLIIEQGYRSHRQSPPELLPLVFAGSTREPAAVQPLPTEVSSWKFQQDPILQGLFWAPFSPHLVLLCIDL